MQRYVAGFMFNPSGSVVALVEKNKPEWQAGLLNAIGGKIDGDETVEAAMVREFQEEAGVLHNEWRPLVHLYRPCMFEVYFFTAFTNKVAKVLTVEEELIRLVRTEDVRYRECVSNMRWLLPMALDKNVHSGRFITVEDVGGHP